MNIKHSILRAILTVLLTSNISAQPKQGMLIDKIIASVDDQIVLQSELEREYQLYQAQGGAKVPNLKCQILAEMLIHKLLLARAKIEDISIRKEEIEDHCNYKMKELLNQVGSEAVLEQYTGKSIQTFKDEIRKLIREQLTIDKMQNKIINDISVTPTEVKAFFTKLPTDSLPYYASEVEVRQIVRYPTLEQQDKTTIIKRLEALKARMQAGEQFEQLAKQYSADSGSASSGGELGFWKLGELAPEYEATALALQPGEVSDPVETQFGFHLIQLIARDRDRYNSRHILIKPDTTTLDLEEPKTYLNQLRTAILSGDSTFEKAAQEYSEDPLTAPKGGLLTDGSGGVRMAIDDLSPDVFFTIEHLIPGTISEPVEFTTLDSQQAIRILLLKDKVAPHQANLEQDYEKLEQMALNAKKATALQEWFSSTKASASIDVAPEYQHCTLLQ